ncbi:hypothetical protein [Neobacillus niacini]|uniref:hypothetical protein n=1 Tax=Neobacillus niacini TaxID=86668 RepID=UPI0005EDDF44|nr:hypothetical protein [Neobacillus niacini]
MLYTTLARSLIAIDPVTLDYKVLEEDFMNSMTIGTDGSIYYALGSELHKIAVPETDATLKSITINGEALEGFQQGVLNYTVYAKPTENILVEANQSGATLDIVHSTDKTAIKVIGTDGKSTLTYNIVWSDKPGKPGKPGKPDKPDKPGKPDKPVKK